MLFALQAQVEMSGVKLYWNHDLPWLLVCRKDPTQFAWFVSCPVACPVSMPATTSPLGALDVSWFRKERPLNTHDKSRLCVGKGHVPVGYEFHISRLKSLASASHCGEITGAGNWGSPDSGYNTNLDTLSEVGREGHASLPRWDHNGAQLWRQLCGHLSWMMSTVMNFVWWPPTMWIYHGLSCENLAFLHVKLITVYAIFSMWNLSFLRSTPDRQSSNPSLDAPMQSARNSTRTARLAVGSCSVE